MTGDPAVGIVTPPAVTTVISTLEGPVSRQTSATMGAANRTYEAPTESV